MGEFNINKSDGSLDPTAGMPDTYPATQVMMSDGATSVEEAVDEVTDGLSDMTNKFKTSGSANDFTVFAADSGVVVLYTYVPAIGKNVGFKRNIDGTITGYID